MLIRYEIYNITGIVTTKDLTGQISLVKYYIKLIVPS